MSSITKQHYFFLIIFMLMASTFLPLIFNNLPPIIRSHHIWTVLWGLSLIFFYPSIFQTKGMIILGIYGLFLALSMLILWPSMNDWNWQFLWTEYYQLAIGISVYSYFTLTKDYKGWASIAKWTLIFVFITGIMTIISSAIDPMYARNLVGVSGMTDESEKEVVMSFQRYGGGAYGYAIAFMSLVPLIIFYYKHRQLISLKGKYILTFLFVVLIALTSMQIFTNIIIAYSFAFFAFMGMRHIRRVYILFAILFAILYSIPKNTYVNTLIDIGDLFDPGSELNYKFTDMAYFIENGESIEDATTGAGQRAKRYPMLWDAFSKSPILGCYYDSGKDGHGYPGTGAHLYWMNKLTVTGVVGFLVFMIIPLFYLKEALKVSDQSIKYYVVLGLISVLLYGVFKSISGREAWYTFFIILPGIKYLPLVMKQKRAD